MGHPFAKGEPVYDVTFENVQAGLRTDYLFRLANQRGGFVVGTGDLSRNRARLVDLRRRRPDEPLWRQCRRAQDADPVSRSAGRSSSDQFDAETDRVLQAILDTKISPELVPADEKSGMQSTEDRIGPYELHDFFLFHILRHGQPPSKVAFLAWQAWQDAEAGLLAVRLSRALKREYDLATIRKWLEVFLFRFFQISQFKRSAIPNSPKVSAGGALSPRGDWRAPSDGTAGPWLDELKARSRTDPLKLPPCKEQGNGGPRPRHGPRAPPAGLGVGCGAASFRRLFIAINPGAGSARNRPRPDSRGSPPGRSRTRRSCSPWKVPVTPGEGGVMEAPAQVRRTGRRSGRPVGKPPLVAP